MNATVAIPILAFATCGVLTPAMRALALRLGIVDLPDGRRKLHRSAIPLAGGLAVCLAIEFALTVSLQLPGARPEIGSTPVIGLAIAANLIVLLGLLDDRIRLRGRQKLAGQIVAASVLVASWRFDAGGGGRGGQCEDEEEGKFFHRVRSAQSAFAENTRSGSVSSVRTDVRCFRTQGLRLARCATRSANAGTRIQRSAV